MHIRYWISTSTTRLYCDCIMRCIAAAVGWPLCTGNGLQILVIGTGPAEVSETTLPLRSSPRDTIVFPHALIDSSALLHATQTTASLILRRKLDLTGAGENYEPAKPLREYIVLRMRMIVPLWSLRFAQWNIAKIPGVDAKTSDYLWPSFSF